MSENKKTSEKDLQIQKKELDTSQKELELGERELQTKANSRKGEDVSNYKGYEVFVSSENLSDHIDERIWIGNIKSGDIVLKINGHVSDEMTKKDVMVPDYEIPIYVLRNNKIIVLWCVDRNPQLYLTNLKAVEMTLTPEQIEQLSKKHTK
jgi:hypothetical protein